jgi:hypothetical protein
MPFSRQPDPDRNPGMVRQWANSGSAAGAVGKPPGVSSTAHGGSNHQVDCLLSLRWPLGRRYAQRRAGRTCAPATLRGDTVTRTRTASSSAIELCPSMGCGFGVRSCSEQAARQAREGHSGRQHNEAHGDYRDQFEPGRTSWVRLGARHGWFWRALPGGGTDRPHRHVRGGRVVGFGGDCAGGRGGRGARPRMGYVAGRNGRRVADEVSRAGRGLGGGDGFMPCFRPRATSHQLIG